MTHVAKRRHGVVIFIVYNDVFRRILRVFSMKLTGALIVAGVLGISSAVGFGQTAATDGPYKVLKAEKVGGEGGFDYIDCDPDTRHLYIVRSAQGRGGAGAGPQGRISVYDMDTLKLIGEIPDVNGGHGVAVDPKSGHAVSSSRPPVVFDTKTLAKIGTVDGVQGGPDGILYEPFTQKVYILSHSAPNVTVIDPVEGKVVGTIDLGGAPEEGCSDGKGHVYIDVESGDNVAVVDAKTMTCTGHYDLQGKGTGPAGLALDPDNGIIFCYCRPTVCVVMSAADGKILDVLQTGSGVDAAEFNPATKEAFSSHGGGSGTLTIIKENSPTSFTVEQNVTTKAGAKCSTLDTKTGNIYLDTADRAARGAAPAAAPVPGATQPAGDQAGGGRRGGGRGGRGGATVPGSFTIIVVGKQS